MKPQLVHQLLFAGFTYAGINWDVHEYGVMPSFHWSRPFPDDGSDPGGFHVNCRNKGAFHAKMYKLKDLREPPPAGLAPWHGAIEEFLGHRDYVGSWDGVDHKGQDREIVIMEWVDVPETVREWIEEQQRDESDTNDNKWLFGVFAKPKQDGERVHGTVRPRPTTAAHEHTQASADVERTENIPDKDKILVFPAGAIYEILPLWVAKGSGCERDMNNLAKYKARAVDHSVLAWPVDHTKPDRDRGRREITFWIEAMSVTETEDGKKARLLWERLHRSMKRNDRRLQKEERQRVKKEMDGGSVRDEL